jgi:hypothetical protein
MAIVHESGTATVIVPAGQFIGIAPVKPRTKVAPTFQILLTTRLRHRDSLTNMLFYPPFSHFRAPEFDIVLCEINRQPTPVEMQVQVDWAIIEDRPDPNHPQRDPHKAP